MPLFRNKNRLSCDDDADDDNNMESTTLSSSSSSDPNHRANKSLRRRSSSLWMLSGILGLLVGMLVTSGISFRQVGLLASRCDVAIAPSSVSVDMPTTTSTAETTTNDEEATTNETKSFADSPTFVLTLGVEGTGHHFLKDLFKEAPSVHILQQVNATRPLADIRIDFVDGIMMPYCPGGKEKRNPVDLYENMVHNLQTVRELVKDKNVPYVPINNIQAVGFKDAHELSYPDSNKCNRIMYPNLDIFYRACKEAQVNCGIVYIYRDPYAFVRSNQNRRFNTNIQLGIHLYTMMLQVLYAQLSLSSEPILACMGLYDDDAPDEERWHLFRDLYGWTDAAAFDDYVKSVYIPHAPMTLEEKDELVPPAYRLHMEGLVRMHDQVLDLCRRQRRKPENSASSSS